SPCGVASHCFFASPAAHVDLHSFPTRRLFRSRLPQWLRLQLPRASLFLLAVHDGTTDSNHFKRHVTALFESGRFMALGSRPRMQDRKSTRLNSSHVSISYAVFCLKKKKP